ncbi:MAG: 6-hydroxymethylpterin diphosphokinase MptE-like protein [Thermoplasmata archaeon]|nr:6-hydroxymethylpterin diphosphokinase MptE-like protein [Thermoplasmata archaeon]
MEWVDWEPRYLEILQDFGFDRGRDEEAARLLARLLPDPRAGVPELEDRVRDRVVTVLGNGPNLPGELQEATGVLLAADEATSVALQEGLLPDIIVTDLDGQVQDQLEAQREGALVVVHAHGDNVPALRRWVPQLGPRSLGTTQGEPFEGMHNFGGFTDGDRAVLLADHVGAKEIRIAGFDFDRPNRKDARTDVKLRKLAWARRLLGEVGDRRAIGGPSSSSLG